MDPMMMGGGFDQFGGGGFDQFGGGGGFDQFGGGGYDQFGGGGGFGGGNQAVSNQGGNAQVKTMMQMGLTVGSLSLGFLVLITIIVAANSTCVTNKGKAKEGPILIACFVGLLAGLTWMLRNHLMNGFSILDTLPAFYQGGGGGSGPQQPPQLHQWENWANMWLACFAVIIWGGIYLLEVYCVQPLEENCPPPDPDAPGFTGAFLKMRSIVYSILVVITFAPFIIAHNQRGKFHSQFQKALQQFNIQHYGNPGGQAAAQLAAANNAPANANNVLPAATAPPAAASSNASPATPAQALYNAVKSEGARNTTGNTPLYDATFNVAEMVGYGAPTDLNHTQATNNMSDVERAALLGG